jgi:pimeloyl-ACP methyl ester carboxylesterase
MRPVGVEARMTFCSRLAKSFKNAFVVASIGLGVAGCVSVPSPNTRLLDARELAAQEGWKERVISAGNFELLAFHPQIANAGGRLTIYVEGDGFAWMTGSRPSDDPTPINPVALRLALAHPVGNAAYLARPCQYTKERSTRCHQRHWTSARFAPEVIDAMNVAIGALKDASGAKELSLVGYSGGAAIAALVAARRNDVVELTTVAGNLDHAAWTAYHRLSPLSGSLNAADVAGNLKRIRQKHFIGERDRVIPPELARRWPEAFSGPRQQNIHVIASFDHGCCWDRDWRALMSAR